MADTLHQLPHLAEGGLRGHDRNGTPVISDSEGSRIILAVAVLRCGPTVGEIEIGRESGHGSHETERAARTTRGPDHRGTETASGAGRHRRGRWSGEDDAG